MRLRINPYGGNLEITPPPMLVIGGERRQVKEPTDQGPFIRSYGTRLKQRMRNYLAAKRSLTVFRITKLAVEAMGDEAGRHWMRTPKAELRNRAPLDLLDSANGVSKIARLIKESR